MTEGVCLYVVLVDGSFVCGVRGVAYGCHRTTGNAAPHRARCSPAPSPHTRCPADVNVMLPAA